jgi:mRNA interferase RelE/StbE
LSDFESLAPKIRKQVLRKVERLESGMHRDIKRLRRSDIAYRLRMGDYRVLFDVEGDVIIVRRIGDRKGVYD